MARMTRFGVSLERGLLARFDQYLSRARYRNRSAALREIVRSYLVARDWADGSRHVAALVGLVLHDLSPDALRRLQSLKRSHRSFVISDSAFHLHDDYTVHAILLYGPGRDVQSLSQRLISCRGVVHGDVIPLIPAPPCSHDTSHPSQEHSA